MIKTIAFALFVVLFSICDASAQGINPLPLITQYESGGNPTATSPNSTASGLYGDLNSTWAQALSLCGCGTTAEYPTAASAPPSIQTAANAALINSQGLAPWLCSGCDPPFAAAVAADGGPSAFQTSSLSTDPATYASLDTGTSLASLLGSPPISGGDGTTPTTFPDGTTLALETTTATTGPATTAATPFQWVYNQLIHTIQGQVDSSIQTIEGMIATPALTILALAIAILGYRAYFGDVDGGTLLSFTVRAAIVMAFIQVGNTFYSNWIEQFVVGLPTFFANAFSPTSISATPAQIFDAMFNGWIATVLGVWHAMPWTIHSVFVGFALAICTFLLVIPSIVAMFTVFLIGTFLTLVMLIIGPLMILALLFKTTHRFFHGYVNVLVTLLIFSLVVDIVLGLLSGIMTGVFANFHSSGSPNTDLPSVFGIAVVLLTMGLSMSRLPRLIEAIGGAVAINMDTAGRWMAGGLAADAAVTAARTL